MAHVATITIDHTKVPGDLTDYVGLIVPDGSAGYSALYALCLEGGGDIRLFKSDDTTELAREIVSFSVSAETGEIHYKYAGTLSSSVDTDIHVYADGSSSDYAVGTTYGRNAVWPDYAGVYHFNEGSGTNLVDSTGTENGTLSNAGAWDTSDAKIGDTSLDFAAGNYHASLLQLGAEVNLSVQTWIKRTSPPSGTTRYFGTFRSTGSNRFLVEDNSSAPRFRAQEQRNESAAPNFLWSNPPIDTWFLAHVVTEKNAHIRVYGDGSLEGQATNANRDFAFSNLRFFVGALNNNGSANSFNNSKFNSFRIRRSTLSANWITTEYNNQNSYSTFYSVAAVGGGSAAQAARRGAVMMM